MKRGFGREIAFLSLPVVILGGLAVLRGADGSSWLTRLSPARLLRTGPLRIGYSEFQPLEISPLDVYGGFDWAVETELNLQGGEDIPTGWTGASLSGPSVLDFQLVYRKGSAWHEATQVLGGKRSISQTVWAGRNTVQLYANLETVPKDAVEVRFRGRFRRVICYRGPIPPAWKPPAGFTVAGPNRFVDLTSAPFDVQIVAPGEAFPAPKVSHNSQISFVKAFFQVTRLGGAVYLQLRCDSKAQRNPGVISFSLWDATGKKLDLCSVLPGVSSPESVTSGVVNRNALSSDFPETDILLEVMANEIPCGGWGKYKAPYVADLELSDSGAWPMKVRVPIQLDKAIGDNEFPFRPGNHPH